MKDYKRHQYPDPEPGGWDDWFGGGVTEAPAPTAPPDDDNEVIDLTNFETFLNTSPYDAWRNGIRYHKTK